MSLDSNTRSLPAISEIIAGYASGRFTPVDVVTDRLNRIRQIDPQLNCWVMVDETGAMETARRQTEQWSRGESLPPLLGVTLGIKDIIDVAGWPTRCGVNDIEAQDAASDAPIVRALREVGAIVLGKTVTTPYACFDPPPTKNPWNVQHTPGGSSSGSAAAVAAGMVDCALGTQTGGSIIRPASFCGVSGWKPAWGRLPMSGIKPVSEHLDHVGLLTQRCEGLLAIRTALLEHLAVDDGTRPELSQAGRHEFVNSDSSQARSHSDELPNTISVVREFIGNDAELELINQVVGHLKRATGGKARVEFTRLPFDLDEALGAHRTIMCHDFSRTHRARWRVRPELYPAGVREMIAEGNETSPDAYQRALDLQRACARMLDPWLSDHRVLLSPASMGGAPRSLSSTGNPRYNSLYSLAGIPAIGIPFGVDQAGMPLGIQLACHPARETALFALANVIEALQLSSLDERSR